MYKFIQNMKILLLVIIGIIFFTCYIPIIECQNSEVSGEKIDERNELMLIIYEDLLKPLVLVFISIIISVFTAFVTAKLTIKSFYTKRWWEKKVELYVLIFEKLTLLKKYILIWKDSSENKIKLSDIELNKSNKKYEKESNELRDIESYGSLFISEVAYTTLEKCLDDLDNYNIVNKDITSEHLEGCLGILNKGMNDFRNFARKDLKQNK